MHGAKKSRTLSTKRRSIVIGVNVGSNGKQAGIENFNGWFGKDITDTGKTII